MASQVVSKAKKTRNSDSNGLHCLASNGVSCTLGKLSIIGMDSVIIFLMTLTYVLLSVINVCLTHGKVLFKHSLKLLG